MTTNDPYPGIARLLIEATVGPWERIVLQAEVGDDWGTFEATSFASGLPERGLKIREAPQLLKLLQEVKRITSVEIAPGKEVWRTLVFTLQRDGKFDVEFGY